MRVGFARPPTWRPSGFKPEGETPKAASGSEATKEVRIPPGVPLDLRGVYTFEIQLSLVDEEISRLEDAESPSGKGLA